MALPDYCINGIEIGYLKFSPLEALTLAMTIQITLRKPRNTTIGIPINMKHKGTARTM